MDLLKLNAKLTKREHVSLRFFTACLALVLIYQTYHTLPFFESKLLYFDLFILVLGILGCMTFLRCYHVGIYARCFLCLILYFIVVGMMYGESILSGNNLSIVLEQDLRYVMLFFIGGVFASSTELMKSFHWLMKWLAVISIIFGLLGLLFFDFSASVIEDRAGTWTMSYFYWWASAACFTYWGYYYLFTKKHKLLGLGVLLSYLVLGALFVKRASLVNGLVLVFMYALLNKGNKIGTLAKVALLGLLSVTVLYVVSPGLFGTITESYVTRIESVQDFDNLDRNEETNAYFERATTPQMIFGNGIGHYPRIVGYRLYNYQLNALHVGWANILYKGGIMYALFYLVLLIRVLNKALNARRLNNYQMVCLGVSISSMISLLYEGSWTYGLSPVCISAPLFYLLSNNKDEIIN